MNAKNGRVYKRGLAPTPRRSLGTMPVASAKWICHARRTGEADKLFGVGAEVCFVSR